jgi:hypothetical protein
MSTISNIITGHGCLSRLHEGEQYEFNTQGCECCNVLAGKTLGNDTAKFQHWVNVTGPTEPTEWNLCHECAYAFTYGRDDLDEPLNGYDYYKYY